MSVSLARRWTGQDNQRILHNLDVLASMGKPFIVRVALVPGVTDTDKNLTATAERVSRLAGNPRVELLPYNLAAGGKYAACGLSWCPPFDENTRVNANLEPFHNLHVKASFI